MAPRMIAITTAGRSAVSMRRVGPGSKCRDDTRRPRRRLNKTGPPVQTVGGGELTVVLGTGGPGNAKRGAGLAGRPTPGSDDGLLLRRLLRGALARCLGGLGGGRGGAARGRTTDAAQFSVERIHALHEVGEVFAARHAELHQ